MDQLLAPGLLAGIATAAALVVGRVRARRRRELLNRALHELRRPLQALALTGNGERPAGMLELAFSALEDLDRAVNGEARPAPRSRLVCGRDLVAEASERWREAAAQAGLPLRLYWDAGAAPLIADPIQLAQALDNLVANSIEHGGPPLVLTGAIVARRLRITLADGGSLGVRQRLAAVERGPRRGNGLALVREVAAAHGGRFALHASPTGSVAALELPLADPARAIAA